MTGIRSDKRKEKEAIGWHCANCGVTLPEIKYVMPNYKPQIYEDWDYRPPMCQECWGEEIRKRTTPRYMQDEMPCGEC